LRGKSRSEGVCIIGSTNGRRRDRDLAEENPKKQNNKNFAGKNPHNWTVQFEKAERHLFGGGVPKRARSICWGSRCLSRKIQLGVANGPILGKEEKDLFHTGAFVRNRR